MTNKQLNLCLQLQGLIFTVGTICVALIIGLPLGYALFFYAKHNGIFGMNIYHVPIVPILIMILLVGLLQIVLSCVLSSNLKKETLVERIRYRDSRHQVFSSGHNLMQIPFSDIPLFCRRLIIKHYFTRRIKKHIILL